MNTHAIEAVAIAAGIDSKEVHDARSLIEALLLSSDPKAGFKELVTTGLADKILPELSALIMEIPHGHHHKDNFEHTLRVIENAIKLEENGPDLTLRMAALMHDVGKPATRKFEDRGAVTFHGHDLQGAKMVEVRLRALGYGEDFIKEVSFLVAMHLRTFGYYPGKWNDSGVRRYMTDAGASLERLNKLVRSDVTTSKKDLAAKLSRNIDDLEERIARIVAADSVKALRPAINGEEVKIRFGLSEGLEVGKVMKHLNSLVRSGVILSVEESFAEAEKILQK